MSPNQGGQQPLAEAQSSSRDFLWGLLLTLQGILLLTYLGWLEPLARLSHLATNDNRAIALGLVGQLVLSGVLFRQTLRDRQQFQKDPQKRDAIPPQKQDGGEAEWFRLLAENVSHVFWVVKLAENPQHLYISPSYESVFGLPREQLYQNSDAFIAGVHPADRPDVLAALGQLAQTGERFDQTFRIVRPDGVLRWVHGQAFALMNHEGIPYCSVGLAEDITEQKQATLALQESEARLKMALEAAQIVCWENDLTTGKFQCIGQFGQTGWSPTAWKTTEARVFQQLIPAAEKEAILQDIQAALAQGGDYHSEHSVLTTEQQSIWVLDRGKVLTDAEGNPQKLIGLSMNISDRKELERALQESQDQLADILNNALACIVQYRLYPDYRFTYDFWSQGAEAVFGFAAQEFMQDPQLWFSRVLPDDVDTVVRPVWDKIRLEETTRIEYRVRHKDGTLRWIASVATSRWNAEASCWVCTVIDTDISDRKHAEEKLRRYERVFSATVDAVALLDRSYCYLLANDTYLNRFKKSRHEILGQPVSEIIGKEVFAACKANLEGCLAGEEQQFEFWFDHPVIGREFISVTYAPYRELDGTVSGIVASIRNLTDLKQTEAALVASEARFQTLASNLPGVIYRYEQHANGDQKFTYVSPGSRDLYELEPEALVEDVNLAWSAVHPDDLASIIASIEESAATLQSWQWEGRIITTSGKTKWIQGIARPEQHDGYLAWDGILTDITHRKQAEDALRAERDLLNGVMDTSIAAIVVFDPQGNLQFSNPQATQVLGVSHIELSERTYNSPEWQQTTLEGDPWPDQDQPFHQVLSTGEPVQDVRLAMKWPNGQRRLLSINGAPIKDNQGRIHNLVFTINDITEQVAAEAALRESEARFRLLAENMLDMVCLHALDGTYIYISPSCQSVLGYDPKALIGTSPYKLIHPEDCALVRHEAHHLALTGQGASVTYRIRCIDGQYLWVETLVSPIYSEAGQVVQLQTTSRNVTDKVKIQAKLEHDALHDALTGLPNRSLLMERLDYALERLHRHADFNFAVLFLDLDRFKIINDSMGHQIGDALLFKFAHKLTGLVRSVDMAARLSGDEFVLLLEEVEDVQDAIYVAERILAELQEPFTLQGREIFVNTSIGIVMGSPDYDQGLELLRDADIAMYRAKSSGKACYAIFDPEMHLQVLREMQLENALRSALEHRQFILHYQPIVCLTTGQIKGFEALVRWQHPQQGLIPPSEFIPLAEETGLIIPLGSQVLEAACHQLSQWHQRYPTQPLLTLNINLSAQQLSDPDLIPQLDRALSDTKLDPSYLTLEITESILIRDVDYTIAMLKKIRDRGIGLTIDDFGTGYSSLSYLHRFPFTALKIDRSFVSQL
ncbi:MAG TPA: PAS domain-containing protein, partial [Leptolyngbyaceae cyanobacterium]